MVLDTLCLKIAVFKDPIYLPSNSNSACDFADIHY